MEHFNTDTMERPNIPASVKMHASTLIAQAATPEGTYWVQQKNGVVHLSDAGLALATGDIMGNHQHAFHDQAMAIVRSFDPRTARAEEMMLKVKFGQ